MKRIIALLLLFALVFSAGCTVKPDGPAPTDEPANVTDAPADPTAAPTEAYEEYNLPREPGTNQLIFYWYSSGADYSKCDMWIWYPDADGHGYLFHPCDYGVKVVLNVPDDITEVGFIVRKNCSDPGGASWGDATKDYDGDRYAKITGEVTEVYLKPGDGAQYKSDDGGKTLYQDKEVNLAGIIALDQIKYTITPATRITSLDQVKVTRDGVEIPVKELSSLNNEVKLGVITLAEELDLAGVYTLEIEGYEPAVCVPTEVFDSASFGDKYNYDGPLGAEIGGDGTTFRLWAPTASAVKLNLFSEGSGGDAQATLDMERGEKGVWSLFVERIGHGKYYTYTVTTAAGTTEIVDPYAKAAGVNGNRGMVVDLGSTDPDGWDDDEYYQDIDAYNDAIIWEVHVRDFSNKITSSRYPGKYLAFTETGLVNSAGEPIGLDYLVDLGITHVHLQPVYDYATVDESSDAPQFNWGYDPKNYNVPEGSYSTDPYNGEVRINEFKRMVQALHEAGIGVVMDVVYNHTYSADSCFSGAVPYYYYRYNGLGELSNGSGCGNETASERAMFRKYMVDSVVYWATEYHIDGFRFDLMALHDVDTMQAIEEALHAVNPKALIYGEGWTGGTTTLAANRQANQANVKKITAHGIGGVAVFNDTIRDGLKGSVFNAKDQGYINGNASASTANAVIFGILGGVQSAAANWSVERNEVINYMACHDNNTLWDKLLLSNPDNTEEERLLMNRLGAAIIMLSKGTPFFLAGEEMLRTKDGDHNSYASSDEVNNLDWEALVPGSPAAEMRDLYRGLIILRRTWTFFRDREVECRVLANNVIEVKWLLDGEVFAVAVINPNSEAFGYTLEYDGPGELVLALDGWWIYPFAGPSAGDSVSVEGLSVMIAIRDLGDSDE